MDTFSSFRTQHVIASASLLALLGCARRADPALDLMHAPATCDTTPMKPLGRIVEIPVVQRREGFAVVTGSVSEHETGDALEGAVVDLRPVRDTARSALIWRSTNSKGGFSFDSLAPQAYALRVRHLGEVADTATIQPSAGRVDTLRLRMIAYRCYGY
jgi:Carboxypeptidase regulatory-like domain